MSVHVTLARVGARDLFVLPWPLRTKLTTLHLTVLIFRQTPKANLTSTGDLGVCLSVVTVCSKTPLGCRFTCFFV